MRHRYTPDDPPPDEAELPDKAAWQRVIDWVAGVWLAAGAMVTVITDTSRPLQVLTVTLLSFFSVLQLAQKWLFAEMYYHEQWVCDHLTYSIDAATTAMLLEDEYGDGS